MILGSKYVGAILNVSIRIILCMCFSWCANWITKVVLASRDNANAPENLKLGCYTFSFKKNAHFLTSLHLIPLERAERLLGRLSNSCFVNHYITATLSWPKALCVYCCFYFRCRTAGFKSVFGRSCDRPPRHRFFLVSLCLYANAEMVPKIPSCHYMLLM